MSDASSPVNPHADAPFECGACGSIYDDRYTATFCCSREAHRLDADVTVPNENGGDA